MVGAKAGGGARPALRVYVRGVNFTVIPVNNSELLDKGLGRAGDGTLGARGIAHELVSMATGSYLGCKITKTSWFTTGYSFDWGPTIIG